MIRDAAVLETLVDEVRAARCALHELIARMREDRDTWHREAAAFSRRSRLTEAQRGRFAHVLSRPPTSRSG